MSIAFAVVFGVFVCAILILAVVAVRWALRRDRVARAQMAQRPVTPNRAEETPTSPGSAPNGHVS